MEANFDDILREEKRRSGLTESCIIFWKAFRSIHCVSSCLVCAVLIFCFFIFSERIARKEDEEELRRIEEEEERERMRLAKKRKMGH